MADICAEMKISLYNFLEGEFEILINSFHYTPIFIEILVYTVEDSKDNIRKILKF